MKNIIFISPPAAGKGTQSKLLSEEYNIPHIFEKRKRMKYGERKEEKGKAFFMANA